MSDIRGSSHHAPIETGAELDPAAERLQRDADAQAALRRLVEATDETRRAIERDLHRGAQQRLVALTLLLRSAQQAVPADLTDLHAELDKALASAGAAMQDLRGIARRIHPAELTRGGLGPALRGLARRSPMPVDVHVRISGRLPARLELSAYHVVAEALAGLGGSERLGPDGERPGAGAVAIAVWSDDEHLHAEVRSRTAEGPAREDRRGEDPRREDPRREDPRREGSAWSGLGERIEALGGGLWIDARGDVVLRMPLGRSPALPPDAGS